MLTVTSSTDCPFLTVLRMIPKASTPSLPHPTYSTAASRSPMTAIVESSSFGSQDSSFHILAVTQHSFRQSALPPGAAALAAHAADPHVPFTEADYNIFSDGVENILTFCGSSLSLCKRNW